MYGEYMLIYNLCLFTFCQSVRCHSTVLLMFACIMLARWVASMLTVDLVTANLLPNG